MGGRSIGGRLKEFGCMRERFFFYFSQTSTSAQRTEARVMKTPSVTTTKDRSPVFAKMALREMARFVSVSCTLKTFLLYPLIAVFLLVPLD